MLYGPILTRQLFPSNQEFMLLLNMCAIMQQNNKVICLFEAIIFMFFQKAWASSACQVIIFFYNLM